MLSLGLIFTVIVEFIGALRFSFEQIGSYIGSLYIGSFECKII